MNFDEFEELSYGELENTCGGETVLYWIGYVWGYIATPDAESSMRRYSGYYP